MHPERKISWVEATVRIRTFSSWRRWTMGLFLMFRLQKGSIKNSWHLCFSGPHIKLEVESEINLIKSRGPENEGPFVPVKEVEQFFSPPALLTVRYWTGWLVSAIGTRLVGEPKNSNVRESKVRWENT